MSKRPATTTTEELESAERNAKQEVPTNSLEDDAEKIINLAKSFGAKGFSDAEIQKSYPEFSPHEIVTIINKLITSGHIALFNQKGVLFYKLKDQIEDPELKGCSIEDKTVFTIIKEAGNKGIWIRDIRLKSNLISNQLNKVLKALEGKKKIKAVTSVAAGKRKVYMVFDLEPDSSVTGGAWYSNQDFEEEFVDILSQQCLRFLVAKKDQHAEKLYDYNPLEAQNLISATAQEVLKFISELGISKVNLSEEHIKTILETLFYDGKIEKNLLPDHSYSYRAVEMLLPPPGFVKMPCGVCPVITKCRTVGLIKPKSCSYLTSWLKKESEIF